MKLSRFIEFLLLFGTHVLLSNCLDRKVLSDDVRRKIHGGLLDSNIGPLLRRNKACIMRFKRSSPKLRLRFSLTQMAGLCTRRREWNKALQRMSDPRYAFDAPKLSSNQRSWLQRIQRCQSLSDCLKQKVKPELKTEDSPIRRQKRQFPTEELFKPTVRKEYRMLSRDERTRLLRAMNKLKSEKVDGMSKYEILVFYHTPQQAPGAHWGPAFLPFHRELLKQFEVALRLYDADLALPYWDSSLDESLPQPSDSVLWSEHLFGSSNDLYVEDGPFANWSTIHTVLDESRIVRSLGRSKFGSLYKKSDFDLISSRKEYGDLTSCIDPYFELVHGSVHLWVGGHMADIPISPNDPVFFFHHSFVDFLWEAWRQKQQTQNERIQAWPAKAHSCNQFHYPNTTMRPFLISNLDGMSEVYTKEFYRFEAPPACSRLHPDCNSQFLFCHRPRSKCISKVKIGGNCEGFPGMDICYEGTCLNGICVPEKDSGTKLKFRTPPPPTITKTTSRPRNSPPPPSTRAPAPSTSRTTQRRRLTTTTTSRTGKITPRPTTTPPPVIVSATFNTLSPSDKKFTKPTLPPKKTGGGFKSEFKIKGPNREDCVCSCFAFSEKEEQTSIDSKPQRIYRNSTEEDLNAESNEIFTNVNVDRNPDEIQGFEKEFETEEFSVHGKVPDKADENVWFPITVLKGGFHSPLKQTLDGVEITVKGLDFDGIYEGRLVKRTDYPYHPGAAYVRTINPQSNYGHSVSQLKVTTNTNITDKEKECKPYCYQGKDLGYAACSGKVALGTNLRESDPVPYTPYPAQVMYLGWEGRSKRYPDYLIFLCDEEAMTDDDTNSLNQKTKIDEKKNLRSTTESPGYVATTEYPDYGTTGFSTEFYPEEMTSTISTTFSKAESEERDSKKSKKDLAIAETDKDEPRNKRKCQFLRFDNFILVGYAEIVSEGVTLEDCKKVCRTSTSFGKDLHCSSVMYWREGGHCVVNRASRRTHPNLFSYRSDEDVSYFDYICNMDSLLET